MLRGLDEGLRERLIDALAAVSAGRPSVEGLVEAHGVVLDLTDETLKLLDLPSEEGGGFDIIVRREQLPGTAPAVTGSSRGQIERARAEAAERVSLAEADADRGRVALDASRQALSQATGDGTDEGDGLVGAGAELERLGERRASLAAAAEGARLEHTRAQQAQAMADDRVEHARSLRSESSRLCSIAAGALEASRAVRDPFAVTALEAARERLALLVAAAAEEPQAIEAPIVDADAIDPAVEAEQLEGRRLELEAALLALDTVDPFPVRVALEQLTSADAEGELVASEEAIRLADELQRLDERLGDERPEAVGGGSAIAVARHRLDAARSAVFDAERAVRLPTVDRLDIEALENAHEQVLLAQERADKRLSGARAQQRLDEARAVEQEILTRLGFVTYTEFVMGTSILNVDPERERQLEVARAELASAEDALSDLEADVDAELARAELVARRKALQDEAITLLGRDPADDIGWALRHHRVRVHDGSDRAGRLKDALQSAGIVLGDEELPPVLLIDFARIWLDEQGETVARREQLGQELSEVEARLMVVSDAAQALSRLSVELKGAAAAEDVEDEVAERAARRDAQLEEARSIVRTAEQRLERQTQVEADIAARKAELESATRAEEAVAAALIEAEVEASAAAQAEHVAAAERSRCDAELAAAADAEHRASDALAQLTDRLAVAAKAADTSELERAVSESQGAVDHAAAALEDARRELSLIDAELADLDGGGSPSVMTPAGVASVEEVEWYLLSRVAAQRAVSYAGSVPLVLDDALADLGGADLVQVLSRLERMSSAVQMIVVSEDDEVASWADSVGTDRAMTLYPLSG